MAKKPAPGGIPLDKPVAPQPPPRRPSLHGSSLRGLDAVLLGSYGSGGAPSGRFGRMFPSLPEACPASEADLQALAKRMVAASTDAPSTIPAGFTYAGQFIDHDVTFDQTPLSDVERDPLALTNFRTPALDLDSLYGRGPTDAGVAYEADGIHLKLGTATPEPLDKAHDLPRRADTGAALIGDPRNDENLVVAQLHGTFIRFHNRVVDHLAAAGTPASQLFSAARRAVRWHYQWAIVHDFLPRICGQALVNDILQNGRKFYKPTPGTTPFMPVEFSVAAYRYGHSQIRGGYRFHRAPRQVFPGASLGQLFAFTGGEIAATRWPMRAWDWANFFETDPDVTPQGAEPIDEHLTDLLGALPNAPAPSSENNLAFRNLQRGATYGLPSGQSVAAAMGEAILTSAELFPDGADDVTTPIRNCTPLWYYLLREAAVRHGGNQLGPVGGRIVAEVLIGLIQLDGTSYLHHRPFFLPPRPIPALAPPRVFEIFDLLSSGLHAKEISALIPQSEAPPTPHGPPAAPPGLASALFALNPKVQEVAKVFRRWKPFLPAQRAGNFTFADLVRFAHGLS